MSLSMRTKTESRYVSPQDRDGLVEGVEFGKDFGMEISEEDEKEYENRMAR